MHGCWAAPALLALGQPPLPLRDRIWPSVGNKQGWNANVVPPEYVYEVRKGEKARQVAQLNVDRRRTMEAEITSHAVDFIRRNANATPTRSMHTFHSRWSTFRHCQILSSLAKRVTAIGPTVWPRWTTVLDKFWT